MSKRNRAERVSTTSCNVSRSINRVAGFASLSTRATYRLRGLCRLLPLPWANSTIARDSSGRVRLPSNVTEPAGGLDQLLFDRWSYRIVHCMLPFPNTAQEQLPGPACTAFDDSFRARQVARNSRRQS